MSPMGTGKGSSRPPRASGGGRAWQLLAAVAGSLAAGAGAIHLLHRQGHRVGLDVRGFRPAEPPPPPPTPEDFDAREPGRGRLAQRPIQNSAQGLDRHLLAGRGVLFRRPGRVSGRGRDLLHRAVAVSDPGRLRHRLRAVRRSGRRLGPAAIPLFGAALGRGPVPRRRDGPAGGHGQAADEPDPGLDAAAVAVGRQQRHQDALLRPERRLPSGREARNSSITTWSAWPSPCRACWRCC